MAIIKVRQLHPKQLKGEFYKSMCNPDAIQVILALETYKTCLELPNPKYGRSLKPFVIFHWISMGLYFPNFLYPDIHVHA